MKTIEDHYAYWLEPGTLIWGTKDYVLSEAKAQNKTAIHLKADVHSPSASTITVMLSGLTPSLPGEGGEKVCPICKGSGSPDWPHVNACPNCYGSGLIQSPAPQPEAGWTDMITLFDGLVKSFVDSEVEISLYSQLRLNEMNKLLETYRNSKNK